MRLLPRAGKAAVAAAVAILPLLGWAAPARGSSTRIGILVRPFQGEGLDADKSWLPGAVTFLLQGGLGKIQGVEVVAVGQESLRRSDYLITGALRVAPSGLGCVARISRADGSPPLREVTATEKGSKPDLFVVAAKIYAALREEVAKAGPVTTWPGSLAFPTLSLFALKYHVEAGLPGAEKRRLGLYQRALSLDPQLVEAWLGSGEEHLRRGEISEAGASARKVLRLKPGHPAGTNLLGVVRWREGDRKSAEGYFRKATLADPLLLDAWRNLGRLLLESGREEEAQEVYLAARKAYGVEAGAMPEAGFFAAPVGRGAAAAQRRPPQAKTAVPLGGNEEESPAAARVSGLERKLAEKERQIVLLEAKVEVLEDGLARANEAEAEVGRLRKSLSLLSSDLEALRGAAARLQQAEENGADDRQRREELEARLDALKTREAESSSAKAEVVTRLGRRVAQLTEELRRQSAELERLRSATSGMAVVENAPGVPVGGGAPR